MKNSVSADIKLTIGTALNAVSPVHNLSTNTLVGIFVPVANVAASMAPRAGTLIWQSKGAFIWNGSGTTAASFEAVDIRIDGTAVTVQSLSVLPAARIFFNNTYLA